MALNFAGESQCFARIFLPDLVLHWRLIPNLLTIVQVLAAVRRGEVNVVFNDTVPLEHESIPDLSLYGVQALGARNEPINVDIFGDRDGEQRQWQKLQRRDHHFLCILVCELCNGAQSKGETQINKRSTVLDASDGVCML